jgi:hypothetical protein
MPGQTPELHPDSTCVELPDATAEELEGFEELVLSISKQDLAEIEFDSLQSCIYL